MKKNVANSVCVGETIYLKIKDVFYFKKYYIDEIMYTYAKQMPKNFVPRQPETAPYVGKSYFQKIQVVFCKLN